MGPSPAPGTRPTSLCRSGGERGHDAACRILRLGGTRSAAAVAGVHRAEGRRGRAAAPRCAGPPRAGPRWGPRGIGSDSDACRGGRGIARRRTQTLMNSASSVPARRRPAPGRRVSSSRHFEPRPSRCRWPNAVAAAMSNDACSSKPCRASPIVRPASCPRSCAAARQGRGHRRTPGLAGGAARQDPLLKAAIDQMGLGAGA